MTHKSTVNVINSGVAIGGVQGGQSATPTAKNFPKIGKRGKKSGKIGKKEEESGRKGKNREGSFTLGPKCVSARSNQLNKQTNFAPPDRQGWLHY